MNRKRVIAAAIFMTAVAACTPEPPPFESHYTPPPPTAPQPLLPLAPGSSFVDNFDRPDTPLGLGDGWDMREPAGGGNPTLPPATDGFIENGRYTSAGDTGVYAVRSFRSTVHRVGAEASWERVSNGGAETLVMAVTGNDKITTDLVQLTVNPNGWAVSTRRDGGRVRRVFAGKFDPPLELDRQYRFEVDVADGSVTVRVPGAEEKRTVGTSGLLSERAFWRHVSAPTDRPVGVKASVNMVWVAEEGLPLVPTPP